MIEGIMTRTDSTRAATEETRRRQRWWLIAKNSNGRMEFLTSYHDGDGGESLAVFGHEEEAEMFLYLSGYGDDGWHIRESSTGEIVSVLRGPCSGMESVVLDPMWEMLADGTLGLVGLWRKRFLARLLEHTY